MIEVLHPGIYSSIQDAGRLGSQSIGVPISGAMDRVAMQWANSLLNNPLDSAVLEMSFKGPKLKFHEATTIVLSGADMKPRLNEKKIANNHPVAIKEKDILQLGTAYHGCRTYMAVAGGIQSPLILGSRSQCRGITPDTIISKHKLISFNKTPLLQDKGARVHIAAPLENKKDIPVFKGPEFHLLSEVAKKQLLENRFTISMDNSRMAYVLKEKINVTLPSIWTAPVLPGTVQCTTGGVLIVLMRDAQTTGGYPRILQLSDQGLNLLAQKSTNDSFYFSITPLNE